MPHPLAAPDTQALLREQSFDDLLARILFANAIAADDITAITIHGAQTVMYWLIAKGVELPADVAAQLAEWERA